MDKFKTVRQSSLWSKNNWAKSKGDIEGVFEDCPKAVDEVMVGKVYNRYDLSSYVSIGNPLTLSQAQAIYRTDINKQNAWFKKRK